MKNFDGYADVGTQWIDFMLAGKTLIDCTSLFSDYDLKIYNNIVLRYFKNE